jgi:DsbC/DsbD-like thiol-disulfide interchange protein
LLPGWRTTDGKQMAALHLTLARGWKTYWRSPGDAGIPPAFDWSGSRNLKSVRLHWPRPELFDLNGMTTVGYHDELVLPVEVTPADAARPVELRAEMAIGVCKDVCVPVSLRLAGTAEDPSQGADTASAIRTALLHQPEAAKAAGVRGVRCTVDPIKDGLRLTAAIDMPPLGSDEFTVVETANAGVWVAEAVSRRSAGTLTATADLVPQDAQPFALNRQGVRITVFGDSGRVVEINGCTG